MNGGAKKELTAVMIDTTRKTGRSSNCILGIANTMYENITPVSSPIDTHVGKLTIVLTGVIKNLKADKDRLNVSQIQIMLTTKLIILLEKNKI